MKLLMSDDLKLSAVETEKNAFLEEELNKSGAEVTHTAKTALEYATGNSFDIKGTNTLDDSLNAFMSVKNAISQNEDVVKKFDLEFLKKMKRAKPSKLLQKVVYEVEKDENFDAIYEALKTEKSGALFRAIKEDKEHNLITVYSTRFGVWESLDGYQIKQCETNGNKLRINLADRQESDITKLQDVSRQNYPVATDLRNLFQKGLIQELRKDDNYIVTNLHFKKELEEEDIEKFETKKTVKKDITKEASHTSKTNANSIEVAKAITQNEKEIHSIQNVEIDEMEKYESKRAATVESFADKLQRDLEQEQERERLKLEEKIKLAKNERKKAKEDAVKLLAGGMTIEEAINELGAKKYNDITIQFVQEDLKTEIIDSVQKEAELKKTTEELQKTSKKLEETEEKRQKIYTNYTEELQRRKEMESKAKQLAYKLRETVEIVEEDKKIIKSQTLQIVDLNDAKAELIEDIRNKDENIEILEAEIVEKDETIKSQSSNIVVLENTLNEKTEKIDYIEAEIVEKDETIKSQSSNIVVLENVVDKKTEENTTLKTENSTLAENLKAQASKIEELMKINDDTQEQLRNLKAINKKMFDENTELKDSLKHLKSIESELAKYKKNAEIKTNLTEKVEDAAEVLKSEKSEKTFADMMQELEKIQGDDSSRKNEDEDEEEQ